LCGLARLARNGISR
jgi:hypothetical protein